jgi:hypothetical protein
MGVRRSPHVQRFSHGVLTRPIAGVRAIGQPVAQLRGDPRRRQGTRRRARRHTLAGPQSAVRDHAPPDGRRGSVLRAHVHAGDDPADAAQPNEEGARFRACVGGPV